MKKFFKCVFLFFTALFVLMTATAFLGYKFLLPKREIVIDSKILNAQMECGNTILYGYDFHDRKNRVGKEYILENFSIESKENFKYIEFDNIPQNLINAFISIEDKRFYKHHGVDFLRTGKAGMNYILKKSLSFGGSTITQQLVKNITGDSEKSVDRKIREIFCAINLENNFSKDEIMCMYLNVINLGNRCRGVGAASEYYFSKELNDLTLSECATIAAITNNPTYYNPRINIQNTKRRRDLILHCMLESSYITKEEYDGAISEMIVLKIPKEISGKANSWYTDMVIEDVTNDLIKKYNISREAASSMVYNGKLRIYTAVEEEVQKILEKYYEDLKVTLPKDIKSSFILLDIKTGDILGVVGDIGKKKGERVQNFAIHTKRPTGSAIKPISVYAPALDKGVIKWSSIYSDSPIEVLNGREWPLNANGRYIGDVDIEYALENSLNTVSVRILRDIGLKNSLDFLKNHLNFSSLCESTQNDIGDACDSSLAMGQHKIGVTLKELVGGYTIFEDGVYKKPRSYFKVTDSRGNVLLENEEVRDKAISNESAAIMTKLLEGVVSQGTAKDQISLSNRVQVAGKTGTTSNNCDRYFVGFTPDIVGGCWLGYEFPEKISLWGNPTIKIWDDVLSKIYSLDKYKNMEKSFSVPDGICEISYDKTTGKTPDFYSSDENIKIGWFKKAE